jgi:GNAT superfamily N-acetyltransferase
LRRLDLTIRRAEPSDGGRIFAIFSAGRRSAYPGGIGKRLRRKDFTGQTKGESVWVAETGGRIVGFASIWRGDGFLHHLFVDPEWRRRGVGTRLIDRAQRDARRPLELKCHLRNRHARAFYARRGFWLIDVGISDLGTWLRYRRSPWALPPRSNRGRCKGTGGE